MAGSRGLQTVRDMVLSLGLVLAVVGVILIITLRDAPDDPVREVDTNLVRQAAILNAPYAVEVPSGLSEQWRPTSARVSKPDELPFRWHIGYVTPSQEYAAAGQSNGPVADYLIDERANGDEAGTTTIDDETWTRYERTDGERLTLVRVDGDVATIVTGTGDEAELVTLAESLTSKPDIPTGISTPAATN